MIVPWRVHTVGYCGVDSCWFRGWIFSKYSDPPEGTEWLSFTCFSLGKKIPQGKTQGPMDFFKKKNMDETTLLDLSDGSSKNFWKDGLIEFQFLPQNVRSRFWGVQKLDFWMGFSMNFLKKCVDNFGSLYYLRNKT